MEKGRRGKWEKGFWYRRKETNMGKEYDVREKNGT